TSSRGQLVTVYQDGAGTVAAQPVQGAEQARLAAPRGPQKGHELSLGEAEADVPQDLEPPPVAALVAEPDTVKLELGRSDGSGRGRHGQLDGGSGPPGSDSPFQNPEDACHGQSEARQDNDAHEQQGGVENLTGRGDQPANPRTGPGEQLRHEDP